MFNDLMILPDLVLNRVTMYRLIISYLGGLIAIAMIQAAMGRLDYQISALLGTTLGAVAVSVVINDLFAQLFRAPRNHDSAVITGLILALIVGPAQSRDDYAFLAIVAAVAMTSKYLLAFRHVHLFNPAAIGIVLVSLFSDRDATWWVGTERMTPFVVVGGLLLVRKIRRGDLVLSFFWAYLFATLTWDARSGVSFSDSLNRGIDGSPIWFLGFVMLTEPVTLPPTQVWQMIYGAIVGLLVVPRLHFGDVYLTPEWALVIANAAALPIRSRQKRRLALDQAIPVGPGLIDFVYSPTPPFVYQPGQYMEWTLDHDRVDSRGKRRYFTLASSPTEPTLRIGVKFAPTGARASSFKRAYASQIAPGSPIVAGYVTGDFTLPKDPRRKLAFIAGGIGVTPFRSMVKFLTDRGEQRDIVMLYANRHFDEILYRDVFTEAADAFSFRPVYVLSDPSSAPNPWPEAVGRIDPELIAAAIPDYRERLFYISGSPALVQTTLHYLAALGVKPSQIKTDYFSGLAA